MEKFSQFSCRQAPAAAAKNHEVLPSSEPVESSDEDADNEDFAHHHLLVCTCPPVAKPRAAAAKTAKCRQAAKLWRAVMRTPTMKSLVRVIAYSVLI